ncbi:hypothetical protein [Microlunatus parietis]|uniref:PD-(D/E)XK nuclease superfamily protein n=1 Tax=Microlunatus parietis TaxID=682979 RepID=A0A7Y9I2J8_9ACTN|nr:hypothetical protein [Microlunatus parietis]NYE68890.1 hypothetical protein [Microlunatus parietis]
MNRLQRRNYGGGHGYELDGRKVPGVTTILNVLDKPALQSWAARESASYAIEHWARLSQLPLMQRAKEIEEARYNTNRKAVVKGNRIHDAGEKLARTGEFDAPDEIRSQVEAYAKFLDVWEIETIAAECPVANTEREYAGTLDLLCRSPRLGTILLDVKTGKGVYAETALQTVAYRNCDLLQIGRHVPGPRGGKGKTEYDEQPMIEIDGCWVAHVLNDDVELLPARAEKDEFDAFLYLREAYDWHRAATDRKFDGYNPPIGAAVFPEQFERAS